MSDPNETLAGFNRPRPTDDSYVNRQYGELGIGSTPSLEDIEPHAIDMMKDGKILEGMGLVLGRRIGAQDVTDPDLRELASLAVQDPKRAFGCLLLQLARDEIAGGN